MHSTIFADHLVTPKAIVTTVCAGPFSTHGAGVAAPVAEQPCGAAGTLVQIASTAPTEGAARFETPRT